MIAKSPQVANGYFGVSGVGVCEGMYIAERVFKRGV